MKKELLKEKLKESELFDSDSSIRSLLNGTRYPSYSKAVQLENEHGIPVEAWKDIKSFITDTITEDEKDKKVNKEENLTKELQSA